MGKIDDVNKFVDNSIIKKKAEEGDVESQYDMILRDRENEMYWLKLAAENGHVEAQFDLGCFFSDNPVDDSGVRNWEEAVKWWKLSADQGHLVAQYHMGEVYRYGSGVKQDFEKAITMYRLSAAQGYSLSIYSLSRMYEKGEGAIKSKILALALLNYGCDCDRDSDIANGIANKKTEDASYWENLRHEEIEDGKKLVKEIKETGDLLKVIDRYRGCSEPCVS